MDNPRKIYWQLQAYMFFMKRKRGILIFESRESGIIKDFWIYENILVQKQIEEKLETIFNQLKKENYKW